LLAIATLPSPNVDATKGETLVAFRQQYSLHSVSGLHALGVAALIAASSAPALGGEGTWGVSLELPLLSAAQLDGSPRHDNPDAPKIDRSSMRVGPVIDEQDYGPQVPALLGLNYESSAAWRVGLRAGYAATCYDGGDGGETGSSWQLEPFAGYAFSRGARLRPFVSAGPLLAHTCTGDVIDQGTALLFGLHVGGGAEVLVADWLSLDASLRGLASWGQYAFYSHGETGLRWDVASLRIGAQLGATVWF